MNQDFRFSVNTEKEKARFQLSGECMFTASVDGRSNARSDGAGDVKTSLPGKARKKVIAYTVDFLTKKTKKNNGEVPQYYVKDSHPAIIDREEWALVQEEMARRKAIGHGLNSLSPFSMRIFCGECGRVYGSKVWHSTDQYRKIVWRCNGKYAGKHVCSTPYLNDKDIPVIFMRAISQLRYMRETLIADCEALLAALESTEKIDSKRERIVEERSVVEGLISKLTKQNEKKPIDPETYNSKLESYTQRHNDLSDKLDKIGEKYGRLEHEKAVISKFIADLKTLEEMPVMFTPGLWNAFVERVTVNADYTIDFLFKNGTKITEIVF